MEAGGPRACGAPPPAGMPRPERRPRPHRIPTSGSPKPSSLPATATGRRHHPPRFLRRRPLSPQCQPAAQPLMGIPPGRVISPDNGATLPVIRSKTGVAAHGHGAVPQANRRSPHACGQPDPTSADKRRSSAWVAYSLMRRKSFLSEGQPQRCLWRMQAFHRLGILAVGSCKRDLRNVRGSFTFLYSRSVRFRAGPAV